jgi:N-acetylmuramoyl-L-alanine amidase
MTTATCRATLVALTIFLAVFSSNAALASSSDSRRPLKGKVIILDAGHGGSDPGAVRAGVQEKAITFAIVCQLKKEFEARGATVFRTRCGDDDVELDERANFVFKHKADLFISVHVNASSRAGTQGIQTYFRTDHSRKFAHTVHAILLMETAAKNQKVHTANFWVINSSSVPSILIETGFITHKGEKEKLNDKRYQRKLIRGIANGVERYYRPRRKVR